MHVLVESVERRRFIYPDGFRSVDTMELVCSCGEKFTADLGVTVAAVWDTFEAHRKAQDAKSAITATLEKLHAARPSVERRWYR